MVDQLREANKNENFQIRLKYARMTRDDQKRKPYDQFFGDQ